MFIFCLTWKMFSPRYPLTQRQDPTGGGRDFCLFLKVRIYPAKNPKYNLISPLTRRFHFLCRVINATSPSYFAERFARGFGRFQLSSRVLDAGELVFFVLSFSRPTAITLRSMHQFPSFRHPLLPPQRKGGPGRVLFCKETQQTLSLSPQTSSQYPSRQHVSGQRRDESQLV